MRDTEEQVGGLLSAPSLLSSVVPRRPALSSCTRSCATGSPASPHSAWKVKHKHAANVNNTTHYYDLNVNNKQLRIQYIIKNTHECYICPMVHYNSYYIKAATLE